MVFILNNYRRIIYDDDMITMRMFEVTLFTDAEQAVWALRADISLLGCDAWYGIVYRTGTGWMNEWRIKRYFD